MKHILIPVSISRLFATTTTKEPIFPATNRRSHWPQKAIDALCSTEIDRPPPRDKFAAEKNSAVCSVYTRLPLLWLNGKIDHHKHNLRFYAWRRARETVEIGETFFGGVFTDSVCLFVPAQLSQIFFLVVLEICAKRKINQSGNEETLPSSVRDKWRCQNCNLSEEMTRENVVAAAARRGVFACFWAIFGQFQLPLLAVPPGGETEVGDN